MQRVQERIFLDGGTLLNAKRWARRAAERDKALQKAKDAIAEINAIGVQVKDLDMGLLDFPCKVESGEIVLLCWKLGETRNQLTGTAWKKATPGESRSTNASSAPNPIKSTSRFLAGAATFKRIVQSSTLANAELIKTRLYC